MRKRSICDDKQGGRHCKDVMTELDRGTTKMAGTGMYTGAHIDILICVIYNRQLTALRRIIDRHDRMHSL